MWLLPSAEALRPMYLCLLKPWQMQQWLVALDIKRLVEIQSFRGTRHRKNLPCRGQRTKTNARTCKGPKRTVANKKK